MVETAPDDVRYCIRCGGAMATRAVHGTARRGCPSCGHVHFTDPKVGVGVLCVHDGRVLLVRRGMDPERGRWALPAGFLDAGEDPRTRAAQEVLEETGLTVAVGDVVDVFGGHPGGATVFVLYAGAYVAGTPVAGDDADEARFFGPDELPDLAFESTLAGVRRWLDSRAE
jgi:ADP-ribose pyrophosphatase YjhB (NUDIX family)